MCYWAKLKNVLLILIVVVSIAGCDALQKYTGSTSQHAPQVIATPSVIEVPAVDPEMVAKLESMEAEIKRLEAVIAEKDKLIRSQNVRQKDRDQELQEVNDEATRAQTKLHRLATKPSAASTIAEVEVAMKRLKQQEISVPNHALQLQAQRILSAATVFYDNGEYGAAMNYAKQSHDIINMISDQNRENANTTVKFYAPVMLNTKAEVNLRKGPNTNTRILGTLKKGATLTANAYQGNWLQVHTNGNVRGWVFNRFVEIKENF